MSKVESVVLILREDDIALLSEQAGGLSCQVSEAFRAFYEREWRPRFLAARERAHDGFYRPGPCHVREVNCDVDSAGADRLRQFGGSFRELAYDAVACYANRLRMRANLPPLP